MTSEEAVPQLVIPKKKDVCRLGSLVKSLKLDQDNPYHAELIKEVLSIPDSHRDAHLREALSDWMGTIDFFSEMHQANGQAYCKRFYASMTADSYRQGKLLIRAGDDSDFFYIILSGAVMVLYPRRKVDMELDCKSIDSSEVIRLPFKERIWRRAENHTHFRGVPLNCIDHYDKYFNDLGVPMVSVENVLEKGRAFGELGILYKTKRMADIVCKQDCLIAKVTKERYLQIVGQESQRRFAKTLQFLNQHFYSNMNSMMRFEAHRYLYLFEEMQWKVNSVVFEADSPLQGLFIIREGSVVVSNVLFQLKSHELKDKNRPPLVGIQRLGIFRSTRKKKLVAFKELGIGECFGLQPYVSAAKPVGLLYNYEAATCAKSKLLYCSISKLTEIMKFDKELQKQVLLRFTLKEQLNPIKQSESASTKLEHYWGTVRNNHPPQYRINPILLEKPKTIRSPRIQSLHDQAARKQNQKNLQVYNSSVVPTPRCFTNSHSRLQQPKKCMSRALELRITEDIANSLERKLSQWKKRKGQSAQQHKVMQRKLQKKSVEMRMKHMRMI